MAISGKDLRGSGDKSNVGRKATPFKTKTLSMRGVPEELHDLCRSLVDAEVQRFKLKYLQVNKK